MEAQNKLFRRMNSDGVYMPHQSIYGFASYRLLQYAEISLLLSTLDRLKFRNFLEAGCAEGFYPRLVSVRYGAKSYGLDLAFGALKRMKDYYKMDGVCGDTQFLPIKDKAFDVVMCSNTIEHVSFPQETIAELIRVARSYVLIGVPRALTKKELQEFVPDYKAERDQHVSIFSETTFRKIFPAPEQVSIFGACSYPFLVLNAIYKRTIGKLTPALPLVKAMLIFDRIGCQILKTKTLHMLALLDLTDLTKAQNEFDKNKNKRLSLRHRLQLADFILRGIFERDKETLDAKPLRLEKENSVRWREFMVKSEEPLTYLDTVLSPEVLDFIACPSCKSELQASKEKLTCTNCNSAYPIREGIPILLPTERLQ
jgi:uncharacterized protein YbaR (Trm112 family)/SAM-dependent methyltransferase